jgi:hypothetical protein
MASVEQSMVQNGGGGATLSRDRVAWQFLWANSTTTVTLLLRSPVVRHLPRQEVKFPGTDYPRCLQLLVHRTAE